MKVTKCLYCSSENLTPVSTRVDQKNILECANCKLLMVDTIDKHPSAIYSHEYFQKSEDTGSGYTGYIENPAANLIGKYGFTSLFIDKISSHLDLGCADGSLIEVFSSYGVDSRGLDISKDAVEIAQKKGLRVEESDLEKIPTEYKKNDVISAFDVFEHLQHPGVVLRQAKEALNPGGYIVFSTVAVTSVEPTEYWFSHSLEHYSYFTKSNLDGILTDVFGKDNFAYVEVSVNGIAEFWGIAKNSAVNKSDRETLSLIEQRSATNEKSFFFSLFYNQVSLPEVADEIIQKNAKKWSLNELTQARFFNYFSQGKLEQAINSVKDTLHTIAATNSIFWQALAYARDGLSEAEKQTIRQEASDEILELRGQLFRTRDELHNLRNSRVVGRIIKARDFIGDNVPKSVKLPRKAAQAVKVRIAESLPDSIRTPIRKFIRHDWRGHLIREEIVANKPWDRALPLVSVVVPYYNLKETIDDTLYSLTQQTFKNFEVIVINDGSPDIESVEKLQSIEASGYKAQFIYQENQGVAATRNNGIKLAKGKYIVCLDSDDILEPTYIEKAVAVLETNPDVSLVTSYMNVFGVMTELFEHAELIH